VVYSSDMKPEDLQKSPKLFCENIKLGYSPEFFVMALSSGTQATIYSLTPQHAKRFSEYLQNQIEQFEKQHGPIQAKWDPNVVSPVQKANPPTEMS